MALVAMVLATAPAAAAALAALEVGCSWFSSPTVPGDFLSSSAVAGGDGGRRHTMRPFSQRLRMNSSRSSTGRLLTGMYRGYILISSSTPSAVSESSSRKLASYWWYSRELSVW
uniref:Putative secreted peptide n=1 Tax=Anopheles braziliensis TaxID=58242 RepID=A0A2M3ZXG0_9DIPT